MVASKTARERDIEILTEKINVGAGQHPELHTPERYVATVVEAVYDAFGRGDRAAFEALITDDFQFTSPYDDHIDRAQFFERCWPNHQKVAQLAVLRVAVAGNPVGSGAFVTYEIHFRDGHRAQNTEWLALRDGKVCSVDVYFGASHAKQLNATADATTTATTSTTATTPSATTTTPSATTSTPSATTSTTTATTLTLSATTSGSANTNVALDPHANRDAEREAAQLAPILGRWKVTGTNASSAPGAGAGAAVEGEETYTRMEGGFFVEARWTHRFATGGQHTGISVIGFEPERGSIMCENFDNLGYAREYRVSVDGHIWKLEGAHERATYTFAEEGAKLTVDWEISTDGREWQPLCHLEGRRSDS